MYYTQLLFWYSLGFCVYKVVIAVNTGTAICKTKFPFKHHSKLENKKYKLWFNNGKASLLNENLNWLGKRWTENWNNKSEETSGKVSSSNIMW